MIKTVKGELYDDNHTIKINRLEPRDALFYFELNACRIIHSALIRFTI
jgi:hypothetical protein